jgi:hypothetical protein
VPSFRRNDIYGYVDIKDSHLGVNNLTAYPAYLREHDRFVKPIFGANVNLPLQAGAF